MSDSKPQADKPINAGSQRYILAIEYDGSDFNGWQRQPAHQGYGIQQCLEESLSRVMNEPIKVICAGRTDTGVHAVGQIVHFDSAVNRQPEQVVKGANAQLPNTVRIQWAVIDESQQFHARFSATARSYRYIIYNNAVSSALFHNKSWWLNEPLNCEAMQVSAQSLVGSHDFSSFRAAQCGANSPLRTIEYIELYQQGPWLYFDIKANAFLLHMVRNIAGALVEVGKGRKPVAWIGEVLRMRDRSQSAITAPAAGLYFVRADYNVNLPPTMNAPCYWSICNEPE